MDNNEKDLFTYEYYKELMLLAKDHYRFTSFSSIPSEKNFILWRHDVDFSIQNALKLAQIEAEHGCMSTYFVNIHSEFYNALQTSEILRLQEIVSLGHDLGIHFDAQHYDIFSAKNLENELFAQIKLFKKYFSVTPKVFSFHNPTSEHLKFNECSYAGLINTYSENLRRLPYCSDSNGYWRFQDLGSFLQNNIGNSVQVLTHPGWWQESKKPPRLRVMQCLLERAKITLNEYDGILAKHERLNVSDVDMLPLFLKNEDYLTEFALNTLILEGQYEFLVSSILKDFVSAETQSNASIKKETVNNYHELISWLNSISLPK